MFYQSSMSIFFLDIVYIGSQSTYLLYRCHILKGHSSQVAETGTCVNMSLPISMASPLAALC